MPRFRSPGFSDYLLASVLVAAAALAGWLAVASLRGAPPPMPFHWEAVLALALAIGCLLFAWAFVHPREQGILGSPAMAYILVVLGTMMIALGIRASLNGEMVSRAAAGVLLGFVGYLQAWQSLRRFRHSGASGQDKSPPT